MARRQVGLQKGHSHYEIEMVQSTMGHLGTCTSQECFGHFWDMSNALVRLRRRNYTFYDEVRSDKTCISTNYKIRRIRRRGVQLPRVFGRKSS